MSQLKKCIIWDLDNTLWDGVCLEGPVTVRQDVVASIGELDRRGILHSIASRGEFDVAMNALKENQLEEYFLTPRINWLPKSRNITSITHDLDISLDAVAFIDDDPFEREQVEYMLPEVVTIPSEEAGSLPARADLSPAHVTREASRRRDYYHSEMVRKEAETHFASREQFLASCGMRLTIRPMGTGDIPRVQELMTRTHQLNTTGLMLAGEELTQLLSSPPGGVRVVVAELRDKFGEYGIVGTAMIESLPSRWRLTYLAVSCRVMGRGVERAILSALVRSETREGFEASFRDTGRNRMMRALYQMMGFTEHSRQAEGHTIIFQAPASRVPPVPRWIRIE